MRNSEVRTTDDGRRTTVAKRVIYRPSSVVRRLAWSIPLGWQLSALYALLLVVTLSVVGSVVYTQQESFLVQDTAQRLVARIEGLPQAGPPPDEGQHGEGGSQGP